MVVIPAFANVVAHDNLGERIASEGTWFVFDNSFFFCAEGIRRWKINSLPPSVATKSISRATCADFSSIGRFSKHSVETRNHRHNNTAFFIQNNFYRIYTEAMALDILCHGDGIVGGIMGNQNAAVQFPVEKFCFIAVRQQFYNRSRNKL